MCEMTAIHHRKEIPDGRTSPWNRSRHFIMTPKLLPTCLPISLHLSSPISCRLLSPSPKTHILQGYELHLRNVSFANVFATWQQVMSFDTPTSAPISSQFPQSHSLGFLFSIAFGISNFFFQYKLNTGGISEKFDIFFFINLSEWFI